MSKEVNFVVGILRAGCTVEIDARKWSSDNLRTIVTTAKVSNGRVILRNVMGCPPPEIEEIAKLAVTGGSALQVDLARVETK